LKHNHVTRDIKPKGLCPACDAKFVSKPKVTKPDSLSRAHETEAYKKKKK
jgi:hypothetical protein